MKANIDNRNSKTKRRKVIYWLYRVLPFILIILLSVGTFRIVLAIMLKNRLNAIRAAGYPATLAELNEYYPQVPDDENAAPLYKQAFALYHGIEDKIFEKSLNGKWYYEYKYSTERTVAQENSFEGLVIFSGHTPPPIIGERLLWKRTTVNRQFVIANSACIKQLKQAVKLPKCRFSIDLSEGWSLTFPYISKSHHMMQLLAISTVLAATNHDRQLAIENILTMLKMSYMFNNEPVLISYSIKKPIQEIALNTIEYALNLTDFTDKELQAIEAMLISCLEQHDKALKRACAGHRVEVIDFTGLIKADPRYRTLFRFGDITGLSTLNKLKLLDLYQDFFTIIEKDDISAIEDDINKFKQMVKESYFPYFTIKIFLPCLSNTIYRKISIKTKLKVTIIGIAIERYRLKYHKLPNSLNELSPEFIQQVPNDPFTNKPFRYIVGDIEIPIEKRYRKKYSDNYEKKSAIKYQGSNPRYYFIKRRGWMIYSFGQDGDDDNGIPLGILSGKRYNSNGDIPFRCVRKDK